MTADRAIPQALESLGIPNNLVRDLLKYFGQLSDEVRNRLLEKSTPGKFVETLVQALQSLDSQRSAYDISVKDVETELKQTYESRTVRGIPQESLIPIVRIARGMYALRSKRSMIHRNNIDPNGYDLELVYQGAQWIVSELVRVSTGLSVEDSRSAVEAIQKHVIPSVELIMGRPLVLSNSLEAEDELVIVLYTQYNTSPTTTRAFLGKAMDRWSQSMVTKSLQALRERRLVEGDQKQGYRLTRLGIGAAERLLKALSLAGQ